MPRKPMNSKRRKIHDLSVEQLWVLIRRHDYLRTFKDQDHRLEVWKKNKKFILSLIGQEVKPEHYFGGRWAKGAIYFSYGERPDAWWRYESKEPRRLLSGHCEYVSETLWFGVPTGYGGCDNIEFPEYESQFEYLNRLDLLLPGESEKYDENLCVLPC